MKLLFVAILGLVLGCGSVENIGTTEQAIGQSCINGYDPHIQGWPTRGFCSWMPGLNGTASLGCNDQLLAGEVNIYSSTFSNAMCAKFSAQTTVLWTDVAFNGWNATKFVGGKTALTLIKSVRLGAFTIFQASQGPNLDPPYLPLTNPTSNPVTITLPAQYQVASWYNNTM